MSNIYVLIHDKGLISGAKTFHTLDEELFRKMNSEGWGVYEAVNSFGEGNPRQDKFCERLRYAYGDLDIAKSGDNQTREEKETKKKILFDALIAKAPPTIIISTSNGLQPLWQISNGDVKNSVPYIKSIKGIVKWSKGFGGLGDKVWDIARVIRKPGYMHMKEEPYLCTIIYKSDKTYTIEELNKIFPYDDTTPLSLSSSPSSTPYELTPVDIAIQNLDIKDIVIKAYNQTGRSASFDNTGRLILDGRLSGTFQGRKDDRGFISSSSHEPIKGNRITVVSDILGTTNKESRAWVIKEFNLNWEQEKAKQKIEVFKEVKPTKDYKLRYTWGTKNLDDNFAIIKRKSFIVLAAKRGSGKTTFAFDLACKNSILGHRVLFISLEMEKDHIKEDFARRRAAITIPEERDYNIPANKTVIYNEKIKEIDAIENLLFSGVKRGSDISWDGVKLLIAEHKDLDMVIIDNLDLIEKDDKEDELEKQKRIVKNIMNFTTDQQIPIILIHHYRKSQAGAKGSGMDELSGSGKIADSADYVVKVSRASDPNAGYPEKYCSRIHLQKARGYNECSQDVYFIKGTFVDEAPVGLEPATPSLDDW